METRKQDFIFRGDGMTRLQIFCLKEKYNMNMQKLMICLIQKAYSELDENEKPVGF